MMERTQKQTKNLTEGSPARLILEFAVPMFLGLLFQQFYSMVDTMIVGKFLGMKPLAGVGATGSLNFMVIGFCIGVCNGFAIPVAQKLGAKDYSALRRFVANATWLCLAFSVVMTVIVSILCGDILRFMKTPEDILQMILGDMELKIMDTVPTEFYCNCTRERVEKALISIGREELEKIIREDKKANLHCHFCGKEYDFTEEELKKLLEDAK